MSERGSCDVVEGEVVLKDEVGVVVTGTEALNQSVSMPARTCDLLENSCSCMPKNGKFTVDVEK